MLVELPPGPCRRQADRRWWWLPIGPQWLPVEPLPVDQPWLLGRADPVAVACSHLGLRWPDCSVRFGCWRTQKTETRGKLLSKTVIYHNAGSWRRRGQAGEQVETRARVERSHAVSRKGAAGEGCGVDFRAERHCRWDKQRNWVKGNLP